MTSNQTWVSRFEGEIDLALAARQTGNEGRARVCARRAAGIIIAEYFRRQGSLFPRSSAYELLKALRSQPGISPEMQEICGHFLIRISPDHSLPVDADLIAEASWLRQELLESGNA